jgi:outer membrane receptor protein involved in Fe transport
MLGLSAKPTIARNLSFVHTSCICALVAACAVAGATFAATSPDSDNNALAEVVVSANRIGEVSLQRTPMAISVISPAEFDSKGLSGISDFLGSLPSVNMQSLSPGENDIEMRGLVTDALDPTNTQNRSLVAVYLDDAAITQQAFNPDLHVYDLERIEVIRGPQGTLYGAGSMAGTIRLITKKPDTKEYSGDGDVSVSETDHGGTNYSVRGMLNVPLVEDRLAARLVVYRSDDSGYIDNAELHERDSNPDYATQARLAVRWLPIDSLTVDASATFARLNALGRNAVYPSLGTYTYESLTPEQFTDYFKLYNVTADWDVAFAHLISSTSYIQRQLNENESYQYLVSNSITPGVVLPAPNSNANDIHEFQEELRLVSASDQRLRWITGAYFERLTRFYPQSLVAPGFDTAFGDEIGDPSFNSQALYGVPLPDEVFYGTISLRERQFALFGEATYAIVPKLDLTLGARYFNFQDDFNLYFAGLAGSIAPGEPDIGNGEQKSTGANPRAVLSYKVTDDVMFYGEAARGFRYGGINEPAPEAFCAAQLAAVGLKENPLTFGPDSLWNYTLGEKGKFADGRLLMNVDAFYIDWRNVQTVHDLTCGYYYTENAGKVKSQGVELETKMRVTSALTVGLSGSYTDAAANAPIANLGAEDGDRVPFFPRAIVTLSAGYGIPMPKGKILLTTDYTARSNAYTEFSAENPLYREIPSSKLLNASIGYDTGRWSVSLYGTNLTNDHLVSTVVANSFPGVQPGDLQFWGRPLTVGVHVHVGF